MKVTEIVYSAYPVTDLKRARAFYEGVLGLTPSRILGDEIKAWIEYDIGASAIVIANMASEWKPNPGGGVAALEVDDYEAAISALKASGASFPVESMESPVCFFAVVTDPDGNSIAIHKHKSV